MKKLFILLLAVTFLTACMGPKIQSELSLEEQAEWKIKVIEWEDKIENYDPVAYQKEMEEKTKGDDMTQKVESDGIEFELEKEIVFDERVPIAWYVEKAKAQDYSGDYKSAIKTYNYALEIYPISTVIWHNLGRLNERLSKYDKSIEYYQTCLDTFPALFEYHLDIARMYTKLENKEKALESYHMYTRKTGYTDDMVYQKIKRIED